MANAAIFFTNLPLIVKHVQSAFRPSFPIAEGIGIFIGVAAWDVLSAGEMSLLKAALVASGGALILFFFRCLQARLRSKRQIDRL
ncbi:MAG TPA: hypothetical protein PLB97_00620 [Accumulibacter sp.]|nr:hypothetical protein [Accumulibacter sp.]HPP45978.1 hypothetical protein [Accumulibacter sp.]